MEPLEDRVREAVLRQVDLSRDVSDEEMLSIIQNEICRVGRETYLSLEHRMEIQKKVFHGLRKLDVLEELLEDDTITEIMVNGANQIYVERNGRIEESDLKFSSEEKLEDIIQKIVAANNKVVNSSHPIVDTN